MLGLSKHEQAFFVGIRSTFYRLAMITGQGFLVILAGQIEESTGDIPFAWMVTFIIIAALFLLFFIYHLFVLPFPKTDEKRNVPEVKEFLSSFLNTFISFFKKKEILIIVAFILLYRLGEAQLVKLASPFLLDTKEVGGLALTTSQVGFVYGTVGIIALSLGGILGGIAAAKHGLKFWIWWMLVAINLPDLVYVYLAATQTSNYILINICVAIEQFGYGFGFTAFMLYLIYISEGEYKTAHFAIATGLMALGMMLPGMLSGWIQEEVGYLNFFIWVCISTIPAFIITKFVKIDPQFGKKAIIKS
jgi:PAT family beta-lactamase induction signal transducer AmpG